MDQNSRVSLICGGIIKWGVFLFVFLLPLFFLPFNSIILELNKQLLLVAFAVILLISWLGKMIAESRIEIKKSFLNLGIIFFLIFYLASSLFSPNRYQSLVGFGATTGESFFTLLALAVIFYVIVNNFKTKEDILNIASILTASGLVAGILGMLQLMGKFFLPWDFAKDIAFNTIGSINSLEIFLGFLLIVSSVLFAEAKAGLPRQIFFGGASLFFLFMVLSINFTNVWIIALISTVLIVALGIINRDQISQFRLILPMVVLVFAVLMLLVRFNIFNLLTVPSEVSPSLGASVQIQLCLRAIQIPGFESDQFLERAFQPGFFQSAHIAFNGRLGGISDRFADRGDFHYLRFLETHKKPGRKLAFGFGHVFGLAVSGFGAGFILHQFNP